MRPTRSASAGSTWLARIRSSSTFPEVRRPSRSSVSTSPGSSNRYPPVSALTSVSAMTLVRRCACPGKRIVHLAFEHGEHLLHRVESEDCPGGFDQGVAAHHEQRGVEFLEQSPIRFWLVPIGSSELFTDHWSEHAKDLRNHRVVNRHRVQHDPAEQGGHRGLPVPGTAREHGGASRPSGSTATGPAARSPTTRCASAWLRRSPGQLRVREHRRPGRIGEPFCGKEPVAHGVPGPPGDDSGPRRRTTPPVSPRLVLAFLLSSPLGERRPHRRRHGLQSTPPLEAGARLPGPLTALTLPLARLAHGPHHIEAPHARPGTRLRPCGELRRKIQVCWPDGAQADQQADQQAGRCGVRR